jgi:hypothetical protein
MSNYASRIVVEADGDVLVTSAMSMSTDRSPALDFHETFRPSAEMLILPSFFLYCAAASGMVEERKSTTSSDAAPNFERDKGRYVLT